MLTDIDGSMLAEVFPSEHRLSAVLAGKTVVRALASRQWTERFSVQAGGQSVLIPVRLHFASERLRLNDDDEAWRFARALQTRSNDGFERQRAARDLLVDLEPWGAPFIVALIGEYVGFKLTDRLDAAASRSAQTPANDRLRGALDIHNSGPQHRDGLIYIPGSDAGLCRFAA